MPRVVRSAVSSSSQIHFCSGRNSIACWSLVSFSPMWALRSQGIDGRSQSCLAARWLFVFQTGSHVAQEVDYSPAPLLTLFFLYWLCKWVFSLEFSLLNALKWSANFWFVFRWKNIGGLLTHLNNLTFHCVFNLTFIWMFWHVNCIHKHSN